MFRRSGQLLLMAVLVLAVAGASIAGSIGSIVDQVSLQSYSSYLKSALYAGTGSNRGIGGNQHDLARNNMFDAFSAFGLNTYLDPFSYGGSTYYNVVGVHQGMTHPEQVYIVGAHYDSANNPGADDNASGCAGVLEAARVLSQYSFDSTLVFVGFDREEQGLIGSTAYVNANKTDSILGMISLDMIAYNPTGAEHDRAYIYGRTTSGPIKNALASAVSTYGNGIAPVIAGDLPASDHAPFEAAGFQAALLIEYGTWSNPYYHTASDSINTLNYIDYTYATNMTRCAVGYLATSAGTVAPEPGSMVSLGFGAVGAVMLVVRRKRSS